MLHTLLTVGCRSFYSRKKIYLLLFLSSEEDRYDSYSRMILKYFLAEGVVCRHELFVASAQDNPDDILQVREEFSSILMTQERNQLYCKV